MENIEEKIVGIEAEIADQNSMAGYYDRQADEMYMLRDRCLNRVTELTDLLAKLKEDKK